MQPYDVVIFGDRRWEVTGIYLGGDREESVVGLRSLTAEQPSAHGKSIAEMYVPDKMLREFILNTHGAGLWRVVPC